MKKMLAAAVAALALAPAVQAADFSDTFIGYRYSTGFTEPGIAKDVPKSILMFQHFSTYRYGSNFFNLDILKSNANDPAAGAGNTNQAQELYFAYRHNLSLSKVTGRSMAFGPVRDVSITAGLDAGSKDTTFAPRPLKFVLGPTLSFGIPNGFLDVGLFLYNESNNNGITGRKVDFDNTWQLSAVWRTDFTLGLPAVFKGFLAMTGPKGQDGFGAETKTETLLRPTLVFDVGSAAGLNKGTLYLGVAYEYFNNKFGNNAATVVGSRTSTPMLVAEWHF